MLTSSARACVAVIAGAALAVGGTLVAITPAVAAVGATYHVSATGNDSTGDGTSGAPYATVQKAVDVAVDGDTVSIGAGSFAGANISEDLTIAGAAGTTSISSAFNLGPGAEGATITGLHFTSAFNQIGLSALDGTPVTTIGNNTFDMPTDSSQVNSILLMGGASGVDITANTFVGSGTPVDAAAINIIGDPSVAETTGIDVHDNISTGYTNFLVAVSGPAGISDVDVTDNDVSGTNGSAAIYLSEEISELSITGNYFHGNNGGVRLTLYNGGSAPLHGGIGPDVDLSDNIFADNLRGIRVEEAAIDSNVLAIDNVFVGNTDYAVSNTDPTYVVDASGSNWSTGTPGSSGTDSVTTGVEVTPVATEPPFSEPATSSGAAANQIAGASAGATTTDTTVVHLGASKKNTWFAIWGYSTKTFLGWKHSDSAGDLSVVWPTNPLYGNHQLALLGASGDLVGWVAANGLAETAFVKSPVPGISGTAQVGRTLTAIPRTWDPVSATLTLQWRANGVDIAGQTANTLVVTPALLGKKITLAVTGTKVSYATTTRVSPATPAVLPGVLSTAVPVVSGSRTVGATLTATPGTWGPGSVALTYRWLRDGVVITGATSSTYVQVAADRNHRIQAQVTGALAGYTTVRKTSASANVTGYRLIGVPTSISLPASPKVGTPLAITVTGAWTTGAKLSYQWRVAGVVVKSATKATYTPVAADFGKTITVRVIATKSQYTAVGISSVATSAVAKGTFTTAPTPTVTVAQVGSAAGVSIVASAPASTSYTYQWILDGADITGATGAKYTPSASDYGHQLSVRVTTVRAGFTAVSATSAAKTVVKGVFAKTTKPKVSGTVKVGRVLTAVVSAWSPSAIYAYQWKLNGQDIVGAVDNTYTVSSEDIGGRLSVAVTGVRPNFTSVTETSNLTIVVK